MTPKDKIIDDMDDSFGLSLTDDEHDRLRKLTESELMFVTVLLARAVKHTCSVESDADDEQLRVFESFRPARERATSTVIDEASDDDDPPDSLNTRTLIAMGR
jgi:hypothetical protein